MKLQVGRPRPQHPTEPRQTHSSVPDPHTAPGQRRSRAPTREALHRQVAHSKGEAALGLCEFSRASPTPHPRPSHHTYPAAKWPPPPWPPPVYTHCAFHLTQPSSTELSPSALAAAPGLSPRPPPSRPPPYRPRVRAWVSPGNTQGAALPVTNTQDSRTRAGTRLGRLACPHLGQAGHAAHTPELLLS